MISEPNPHWYELTIDRFPVDPVVNLLELKSRLRLSQAFLDPALWGKMLPALERAASGSNENYVYWKFMEVAFEGSELITIIVYSEVYLMMVDAFQCERKFPVEIPIESFQRALQEEFRLTICGLLSEDTND